MISWALQILTPPQVVGVQPQAYPSTVAVIVCRIPWAPKKSNQQKVSIKHRHSTQDFRDTSLMMAKFDGRPLPIEDARDTGRGARSHTAQVKKKSSGWIAKWFPSKESSICLARNKPDPPLSIPHAFVNSYFGANLGRTGSRVWSQE